MMHERFKAVSDGADGITVSNLRMDYELRPDGLDDSCLYDFVNCWQKEKRSVVANALLSDEERLENGIEHASDHADASTLFAFRQPHLQHETWGVRFRADHDLYVPVIRGPVHLSRANDPVRFARYMLVLFKPFRAVSELRKDGQTWPEAFAELERSASPRIKSYMVNVEVCNEHHKAWEQDREQRNQEDVNASGNSAADALDDSDGENNNDSDDDEQPQDDEQMPDAPAKPSTNFLLFNEHDHNSGQQELYEAALRASVFDVNTQHCIQVEDGDVGSESFAHTSSGITSNVSLANPTDVENAAFADRYYKQLRDDVGCETADGNDTGAPEDREPWDGGADREAPQPAVILETPGDSIAAISAEFQLNKKQRIAFQIIARTFLAEFEAEKDPTAKRPKQLLIYIGGPGGTGKSTVIHAVQTLFQRHGRENWLKTCAPTGTAANAVRGSTLFSLLGMVPYIKKGSESIDSVALKESQRLKTVDRICNTKFLVVDEISMVGGLTFAEMDQVIKSVKGGSADVAWAGMHVIATGDYAQLKPIGGSSLFAAETANPAKSIQTRTGRELWLEFTNVIFLEEQMRQRNDAAFGYLLDRLRVGESDCCCRDHLRGRKPARGAEQRAIREDAPAVCRRVTLCDYHRLSQRYLPPSSAEARDPKWQTARLVTHSNPVSAAWNRDAAVRFAAATGQPVLLALAEDSRPKARRPRTRRRTEQRSRRQQTADLPVPNPPLTPKQKAKLLRLPDSQTGSRLGVLPLVIGMRVILRDNLATEHGLVNGAEGTIIAITVNPEERLPPSLFETSPQRLPQSYPLRSLPSSVTVRFDNARLPKQLPGTSAPNEVIIVPGKKSYKYDGFKRGSNTVTRRQFPLTPCQSMTIAMVQGKSLKTMIADLDMSAARQHKLTQLYVMLSRAHEAAGLRLLRPFHHRELHRPRDRDIHKEEARLRALEQSTLATFAAEHPLSAHLCKPHQQPDSIDVRDARDAGDLLGTTLHQTRTRLQPNSIDARERLGTKIHHMRTRLQPTSPPNQSDTFNPLELVGTKVHHTPFRSRPLANVVRDPRELLGTRIRYTRPLARHLEPELPWCVPRLRLNDYDRSEITSWNLLNDKIINVFQELLSEKFTVVRGWQPPAVAASPLGYEFTRAPSVQIHHNSQLHWLTSARTDAGIFVADSLHSQPTVATRRQLCDLYAGPSKPFLDVTYLPSQRQTNGTHCGDFAIAFAANFALHIITDRQQLTTSFANLRFNQQTMRQHLLACLTTGQFKQFPAHASPLPMNANPMAQPITYRINCSDLSLTLLPDAV